MNKIGRNFKCNYYEYSTNVKYALKQHAIMRDGYLLYKHYNRIRGIIFKCNISFSSITRLKRHKCPCIYLCKNEGNNTNYMVTYYKEMLLCDRCGVRFSDEVLLMRHIITHSKLPFSI